MYILHLALKIRNLQYDKSNLTKSKTTCSISVDFVFRTTLPVVAGPSGPDVADVNFRQQSRPTIIVCVCVCVCGKPGGR